MTDKKMTSRIYLSLPEEQIKELKNNHLEFIKLTNEIISLQEYIRRILVNKNNKV